jgi:serine/threonine protein kinase
MDSSLVDAECATVGSAVLSAPGGGMGTGEPSEPALVVADVKEPKKPTAKPLLLLPYVPQPIIVIKDTAYHLSDVATSGAPQGSFGAVYRVHDPKNTTFTFVLKCPVFLNNRAQYDALRCEIELYGRLGVGNKFIAGVIHYELIPVTVDKFTYDVPHLLMMRAKYGSLQNFLSHPSGGRCAFFDIHPTIPTQLSAIQYCCRVFDIMMQVTCGLSHAHSNGVVHADIKPLNILVTKISPFDPDEKNDIGYYNVAICDFGCSVGTKTGSDMSPRGTKGFQAPEQAVHSKLVTDKTDVYTLAKVIESMLRQFMSNELDGSPSLTTSAWLERTLGFDVGSLFSNMLESCLIGDQPDDRPDIDAVLEKITDGCLELNELVDDEDVLLFRGLFIASAQNNNYAPFEDHDDKEPDGLGIATMALYRAIGLFRNYELFGDVIDVAEVHNELGVTSRICLQLLNVQICTSCAARFSGDVYCPLDSAGILQCRCGAAAGTSYASTNLSEKILGKTLLTLNRCAIIHKKLKNFTESVSLFDVCCYCSNETDLIALQSYAMLAKHYDSGRSYDEIFVRRIQSRFVSAVALDSSNVDVLIKYASFLHYAIKDFTLALTTYKAGIDLMESDELVNTSAKFFKTMIQYACCLEDNGNFSAADCSFSALASALAPEDPFVQEQYGRYLTRVSLRSQ